MHWPTGTMETLIVLKFYLNFKMNELVAARFTIMFAQLLLVLLIPSTSVIRLLS